MKSFKNKPQKSHEHFTDFEHVIIMGNFANFEHVKIDDHLLTLNNSSFS